MSDPMVSVVIPAYNAERTIVAAVGSALGQTFRDLEVIVVDDGSSDRTRAVVEAIPDDRVRLIPQPNGGAAAARNAGILASRGGWLALLDADDLWLPDKLERQLAFLEANPTVRAVQGSVLFVNDDLDVVGIGRCRPSRDALLETLRFQNLPAHPTTVLVDRDLLVEVGMFDPGLVILEDWDVAIKLSRHADLRSIVEPLALYRVHPGNRSRDIDIHLAPGLTVLDRLFADPTLPPRIKARERELRARLFAMLAGGHLKEGNPAAAARWAAKAVRTSPQVVPYLVGVPLRRLTRRLRRRRAARPVRTCPACHAILARERGERHGFEWRSCTSCGTWFVGRLPSDDELNEHHRQHEGVSIPAPEHVRRRHRELVASWRSFRQIGKVLDIGFGAGDLLRAAAGDHWECWGVELSEAAIAAASDEGWHLFHGHLAEAALPPAGFDVVAMVEVLQHVPDPADHVRRAAQLLRPAGLLWGTTPNALAANRRALGTRWSVVDAPEHLQLFSPDGLRRLLESHGFHDIEIRTEGINPAELLARLRHRAAPAGIDRVLAGQTLDAAVSGGPGGARLKDLVNRVLRATHSGDTLEFRATR